MRGAERIMPVVLAIAPRANRNIRWVGRLVVERPVLKDMCLRCLYALLWLLNAYVIQISSFKMRLGKGLR